MDQVWMFLSQQAGQRGREREVRLGKFLCDDWTAFGPYQLEWHGLREGRHGVESLTSAVCAFRLVLSYELHTHRRPQLVVSPSSGLECACYVFHSAKMLSFILIIIYLHKEFSETCLYFLVGSLTFSSLFFFNSEFALVCKHLISLKLLTVQARQVVKDN